MQEKLEGVRRTLPWWLLGSFVALLIAGALWFQFVYRDPRNAFEGMLAGTMAVTSYTKQTVSVTEEGESTELRRIQFGAQPVSETVVTQKTGEATVTTETLSTLQQQFVRFAAIETTQKTPTGEAIDFSNVRGIWGFGQTTGDPKNGPYVNDVLTGSDQYTLVIPMADIPIEKRGKLMQYLAQNHVFVPDYSAVTTEKVNGRSVYKYPVQLQMQTYVGYLKLFGESIGLADYVSGLDPTVYQGVAPVEVTMYVDPLTRRLARFDYDAGIARQDTFMSYGIMRTVDTPVDALPMAELQGRINRALAGEE